MAKSFKKKKNLPKYTGGGASIYDESGNRQYGETTNKMAGFGEMAGSFGNAMGANEDQFGGDFRSQNDQQEGAIMNAVGEIGPVGKVIKGAYGLGQGIGTKIRARVEATDETGKLKDPSAAKRNAVIGGLFDPFKAFKTRSSYSGGFTDISGKGYTKHLESEAQKRIAEEKAPQIAAERAETQRKLQYGTFRQGGMSYPTNAIPMHGGNWAIPTFPNGGTFQVDGPSHEQGGVEIQSPNGHYEVEKEEAVQPTPEGDRILSDNNKLKLQSTGKNPAQSYKPYQNKLDRLNKLSSKGALDKYGKSTLKLTEQMSEKAFDKLYDEQEFIKTTKISNYIKRLGGNVKQYGFGGQDDPIKKTKSTGYSSVDPSDYVTSVRNKKLVSAYIYPRVNTIANTVTYPQMDSKGRYLDSRTHPWLVKPMTTGPGSLTGIPVQPTFTPQYGTGVSEQAQLEAYLKANQISTPVNRYGGLQKFDEGGDKKKPNPNNPYNSIYDFNMPVGGPLDQQILRDKNQSYMSDKTDYNYDPTTGKSVPSVQTAGQKDPGGNDSQKTNWQDIAYQTGMGLANNAGEIAALYEASKGVEKQDYYDYKPEVLNNTAAERAAWKMYKNTAESLKNAGLSGGQYASNLGANRASLTEQLDTQRINRENVNAQIRNQGQMFNIPNKYMTDDINARNRAAQKNLKLKAIERMGTNTAQSGRDYKATKQEQEMLPFMKQAFSDPAFQKMFSDWMASKGK